MQHQGNDLGDGNNVASIGQSAAKSPIGRKVQRLNGYGWFYIDCLRYSPCFLGNKRCIYLVTEIKNGSLRLNLTQHGETHQVKNVWAWNSGNASVLFFTMNFGYGSLSRLEQAQHQLEQRTPMWPTLWRASLLKPSQRTQSDGF
jgi:hypothetical protein